MSEAGAMPLDRDVVTRKVANLPSLSRTAIEILQSIDDERADTEILARKIAGDQSLVARMLRVANSPFYGLSGRVTTIQDAIVILGLRSVRMLATAASVASGLQRITTPGLDFTVFWRNSIGTALGALPWQRASRTITPLSSAIGRDWIAICWMPNMRSSAWTMASSGRCWPAAGSSPRFCAMLSAATMHRPTTG